MDDTKHGTVGYQKLSQKESIPACTSFECKKASAADEYDMPTDNGNNEWQARGKAAKYAQIQRESVPACTSFECKKGSAADEYDMPTDNGTNGW